MAHRVSLNETVVVLTDLDSFPTITGKVEGFTKNGQYIKVGKELYHSFSVWPISQLETLQKLLAERMKLKKAYDESISGFYQLHNKLINEKEQKGT